jgi:hypothetical protein
MAEVNLLWVMHTLPEAEIEEKKGISNAALEFLREYNKEVEVEFAKVRQLYAKAERELYNARECASHLLAADGALVEAGH